MHAFWCALLLVSLVFVYTYNLYYDFHAQVGDDRPSREASVPDTDAADMGGVTGRGTGGGGGRAWQRRRRSGRGKRMTSIIGYRSCPLRTSDSDCYVDIMLIAFQEYIVYILCQFPAPLVRIVQE